MSPASRRRQAPPPAATTTASSASKAAKGAFRKPAVLAVAFAAVIVVGSLTGAQLKQDKQKEQVSYVTSISIFETTGCQPLLIIIGRMWQAIKEFRAVQPADQIRTLEEQRKVLMEQRAVLQRKIDIFEDKVKQKKMEKEA